MVPDRLKYVYRNDGDLAVTAWSFRCVIAMNDGRTGWSGSVGDVFGPAFGSGGEEPDSYVQPGETLEFDSGADFRRDGPFAVQTCGLVAVVLADATAHGDPQVVEEIFGRRRSLVGDERAAIAGIDAILSGERPMAGDADFREALARLPGNGVYDSYLGPVVELSRRTGRPETRELRRLRDVMEQHLEGQLPHLRSQDLERIEEAVQ